MNRVPASPTQIATQRRQPTRSPSVNAASAVSISGEVMATAERSAIFMFTSAAMKNTVPSASNSARHITIGLPAVKMCRDPTVAAIATTKINADSAPRRNSTWPNGSSIATSFTKASLAA